MKKKLPFYQLTPDELVDIVDDELNVLHQATKLKAHSEGLLHKTVIAGVRNSKGQLILVKQASDRQDAGQFVSPVGGHVRVGESEEEALKREALEEIGLDEIEFRFLGQAIYNREVIGRKENHYFIYYEILTDENLKLGAESECFEHFSLEQIEKELEIYPAKYGAAYKFIYDSFYRT